MTRDDYFRSHLLSAYRRSKSRYPLWGHRLRYEWAKKRAHLDCRLAGWDDGVDGVTRPLGWWHRQENKP